MTPSNLEYLMVVHGALVQQLNSYGIVLTLLAGVTSVAVLQPPGSFNDQGQMRPPSLVGCFLMFSSVSFLLACSGLMAVIVGSASLFRPWFFPKPLDSESEEMKIIVKLGRRTDNVRYDNIHTLASIILDNLLRVRRLRIYLALSLGLSMVALVCGVFAILGPEKRNLYVAIGTILDGGGVVLVVETGMTLAGPSHPPNWLHNCRTYLVNMASGSKHEQSSKQPPIKKSTSDKIDSIRMHTMPRT